MPDHHSWLTYLTHYLHEVVLPNARVIGATFMGREPATWRSWEPLVAAIAVGLLLIGVGLIVRPKLQDAVIPDERLTLRTGVEVFLGYFYNLAKGMMGPERAKKYYRFIGTAASFIFVSNVLALIPGFPVPTGSLSITAACGLVVFLTFNFYGLAANGWAYVKHIAGPAWYLAILVFPIEVVSLCVRPVTLAVRLMLNMSVDHLLLAVFMGMVPILLPLPVMALGCIVILVQTLVFTLLTTIYIDLATEDMVHHH